MIFAYSYLIVIKIAGSSGALNYCCNSSYWSIGQKKPKFCDFYWHYRKQFWALLRKEKVNSQMLRQILT